MSLDAPPESRKSRSPVERIIVQGGIVVLLVVLAVELRAQRGYSLSLKFLKEISDNDDGGRPMSEVEPKLKYFPAMREIRRGKAESTREYSWFSFFKNGRYNIRIVTSGSEPIDLIRIYTGTDDSMMEVQTPRPEDVVPLPPGGLGFGTMSGGPPQDVPPSNKSEEPDVPATTDPATSTTIDGSEAIGTVPSAGSSDETLQSSPSDPASSEAPAANPGQP